MKGYILSIIVILSSFIICFSASAEPIKEEKSINEIETYRKAIEASKNDKEKALLHKKLGDLFVSKEDFKNASFEMNAEGGNYALGTAAGWRYYLIGLRLVIYF
jgi:uncharacterized membrane protein